MKCAIFNSLPQHHEMFAHVLDYFKQIGKPIDVYTNKECHYGWLDFYILTYGNRDWYPASFFNPSVYDYVFVLTDNDDEYKPEWASKTKIIITEHYGKRLFTSLVYKTLQTRKFNLRSPPSDPDTWVLPVWNNRLYTKYDKLTVMSIGCAARFLNLNSLFSNYNDIQFILVDRYMNLGSTYTNTIKYRELDAPTMIEYASKSHYILFWPTTGYSTNHMYHSMSGSFPLSYSVGTPLLMPESYIEPLGIGKAGIGIFGIPDSSAIHLEKPTQSQYDAFIVERQGLLNRRDTVFNTILYDSIFKESKILTSMQIPKVIYQTWETKDLSKGLQDLVNTWKHFNPNYTHILCDKKGREEFIKANFTRDVYKAYMKIIPGAYKADLWRYCILYINGGIYVDIDTICLGSIDTFLTNTIDFITPIDLNTREDQGQYNLACGFIGAKPKSEIMLACINEITQNILSNRIPESKLDFSGPGVLGRMTNRFMGLPENASLVGKEGIHMNGKIHFLKFERYTEYVTDLNKNQLFQNKCGNREIMDIYNTESKRVGAVNWVTANPNELLRPDLNTISKNFFQKSKVALSADIVRMVKHSLNSDWTYTNFVNGDEETFFKENPLEEFPEIIKRFNEIKRGEHKADLFRYYYLYVKGGVYMDSDAMIYQPIDTIVGNRQFFAVDSWLTHSISNCIIASGKGNPLILEALKQMYTADLSLLDSNFQLPCRTLYSIYHSYEGDKTEFALFKEIANQAGDRIIDADANNRLLFKHFWRNKENIPNHLLSLAKPIEARSKNLVYFCVFYNKDYFKLLDLLLSSMKYYSTTDAFDLLVLTSPDMEQCVHELCTKFGLNIHVMPCNFTTIFQAACARLHIFDYEHITSYQRILYLDTDIIIKADLAPLFVLEIHDILYGLEQGCVTMPNFGSQFFDSVIRNSSKTGINSGTLLFKNSLAIRDLFSRMRGHIEAFTDSGATAPYTMDQPFINYHAVKSDLYDNKVLNPYVSLYEGSDEVANYETSIVCHFSFPIGNFSHKHYRMKEFLIGLLEKEDPSPCLSKKPDMESLVGKRYSWGTNGGYIAFKESHLETQWGNGTYEILTNGLVIAVWRNCYHTLMFSDNNSRYTSLRTGPRDLEWTSGKLDTT